MDANQGLAHRAGRATRLTRTAAGLAAGLVTGLTVGLLVLLSPSGAFAAASNHAAALEARHESLQQQLNSSPFGRPVVLESSDSDERPQGDVYAVVRYPFAAVKNALGRPAAWCDVMMMQTNVKRCTPGDQGKALSVGFVRKSEQTADDAQMIDFQLATDTAAADYMALKMSADRGPLGTSNYSLALEAAPLDAQRTFLHLSYAYSNGLSARLATNAYLATSGRDKVGFSVVGHDQAGHPTYVAGLRGIAERNTMRYYLAIEALLAAAALPPAQQPERRLEHWAAAVERYPRQLKEMERADYLALKRRDLGLQTSVN
jgi:hypothetical protein